MLVLETPDLEALLLGSLIVIPALGILGICLLMDRYEIPYWIIRKFAHISGIALVAGSMVVLENFWLIWFVFFFGLTVACLLTIPPIRLLTRIASLTTRKEEPNTLIVINVAITALTLMSLYFIPQAQGIVQTEIFLSSAIVIALGDGLGELIGRPYGMHEYEIFNKKSVEGSIGVFLGSFLGMVGIFLFITEVPWLTLLIISIVVTFIEAFSIGFSDNLLMPIFTSVILYIVL